MTEEQDCIKTFVILDVEVNGYRQYQYNQCSLTELCFYAFSVNCLQNDITRRELVPELPRVLNKINLMINPLRRIQDHTNTGLDNWLLENESPFDENTAECILTFLNRLQKPVCMVAHNGMNHDFRLIRHVYEKLNQTFPSSIYCVDSLPAFRHIDNLRRTQTDKYALGDLYENTFNEKCELCHQAEADVDTLTKLILHYGKEFLMYAEAHKQTFDKVPLLGGYDDENDGD